MLIFTCFISFANTYLSRLFQKFHFLIEVVLKFFAHTKGSGTSFKATVFVLFSDIISFGIRHKLVKFH